MCQIPTDYSNSSWNYLEAFRFTITCFGLVEMKLQLIPQARTQRDSFAVIQGGKVKPPVKTWGIFIWRETCLTCLVKKCFFFFCLYPICTYSGFKCPSSVFEWDTGCILGAHFFIHTETANRKDKLTGRQCAGVCMAVKLKPSVPGARRACRVKSVVVALAIVAAEGKLTVHTVCSHGGPCL